MMYRNDLLEGGGEGKKRYCISFGCIMAAGLMLRTEEAYYLDYIIPVCVNKIEIFNTMKLNPHMRE